MCPIPALACKNMTAVSTLTPCLVVSIRRRVSSLSSRSHRRVGRDARTLWFLVPINPPIYSASGLKEVASVHFPPITSFGEKALDLGIDECQSEFVTLGRRSNRRYYGVL